MESVEKRVYAYIVVYLKEHGIPPTIREIGDAVGVGNTSYIDGVLEKLEIQGLIERQRGKSRGIRLTRPPGIPVIGTIAAGKPLDVDEQARQEPLEYLPITPSVQTGNAFALRVCGHSMIDAAICDGDYVIIRPQHTCKNGDIVVATHLHSGSNGSATVKRFFQEHDQVRLQPANEGIDPITISKQVWEQEWEIQGKVIGIFRQC